MKRILLICFMLLSALATEVLAQDRTVSGTVKDDSGESIPGVNIILKGTTTGATSDIDGNWSFSVPSEGGTLVFTFVGMATQEVVIGSRSVIDVALQSDATELSEVIVTALGVERAEKALGYSVEKASGDQLSQVAEPDPLRALQGKIPGVAITGASGAPGSSTKVIIRGNSSLLNDNQPLYVVDGVPYNNDFVTTSGTNSQTGGLTGGGSFSSRIADLDPNNIESITVLKGGAGAALYGSRAANGVILVTTKTGSAGSGKKGLEISVSYLYAKEKIANIPDVQNTYGTGTNFSYAQANGSWGAPFIGTKPYANLQEIPHWYAGRPGMEAFDGQTVPYQAYPDNMKDLFNDGSISEFSTTISGGNENSSLSATVSKMDQAGFIPHSNFDRLNLSLGARTTLENGLFISGNIAVTQSDQAGPISGVGSLGQNNPSYFARALLLGRNWDVSQPYTNPVDGGSEFFVGRSNANNPFWSAENTGIESHVNRYVASFNIGYDVTDWLNLNYRFGMNTYNQRIGEKQRPNGTGSVEGTYSENNSSFTELNHDFIASMQRDLSDDFDINVVVGGNVNQRTTNIQQVNGTGYVTFNIDDLDNMGAIAPAGGNYSQKRIVGLYGDVNVGYKDFAFVTLTGRNDWSSTLPKNGNSFFYPAISGSLVISEMIQAPSWMNLVKVRGSWSQVGNDTNPYLLTTPYLANNSIADATSNTTAQKPLRGISGATLSNRESDPNLKPETTQEVEAGIDLQFFNKLGINFTAYKRNTTDQIAQITLADETGFTSLLTNFGEVENKGIEVGVDITPVKTSSGFEWNMFFTYTHNKNTIISTAEGVDEVLFGSGFAGGVGSVHRPGQEFGLLLGSVDARDQDGNLLIDPSNGQLIPATERRVIGNPNPDYIMGFTNTLKFKGFTLTAVLDYKKGGDLYSNQVSSQLGRGVLAYQGEGREVNNIIAGVYGDPNTLSPILDDAGNTIPNQTIVETNTLYFGQTFAANGSDEWAVWDGTVIRLREVSLNYMFPRKWMDKTPFGSASIGYVGRNLWYNAPNFPKDANYDPEVNQFGNRNQQGIEFGATPSAKRHALKVQVTF